jgi:hypothetical protein
MSVYLSNKAGDHLRFSNIGWAQILSLAKLNGWEPLGTVDPWWKNEVDAPQWEGGYCSNDGQTVTAEDALAIANSLEKALFEIIEPLVRPSGYIPIDECFQKSVAVVEAVESVLNPDYEPYSEIIPIRIGEQDIRDLIQFSRMGEFCIF